MEVSQTEIKKERFGLIGLGLIGGSIAKAIRKAMPDAEIIAYDPDTISVQIAVREGVVNEAAHSAGDEGFGTCKVIFLCAPVLHNAENLKAVRERLGEETILTDVGSVKSDIHRAAEQLGLTKWFIGGHPMAGSERIGYRNSKAQILENAYYILTPEADCPQEKADYMQGFVRKIGAIPLVLNYKQHDYATAAISHLPHVLSAAMVNLVRESDSEDGVMKMIAAGGFKDTTRISSSSPEMWEHICMTNPDNIRFLLDSYIDNLNLFREYLVNGDAEKIREYFARARQYREEFTESSGNIQTKRYVLYVDIDDQPGAIAELAVILANRRINIKNMGISHNREYQSGVLGIEFETGKEEEQARFLLISKGYTVH